MTDEYDLDAGPDPATYAAASPESPDMDPDESVFVVGIGPGNPAYLTPRGRQALEAAAVVVGFGTVIEFIEPFTDAELLTCGYRDEQETLANFAEQVAAGKRGVAVAMGDPNHSGYQFVGKVQQAVQQADPDRPVRVVPGISSLQVAASRARTPMEDTEFVTLHKSGDLTDDLTRLDAAVGKRHLLVLPRPYDMMPGDIAARLLDAGGSPTAEALVLEKLTHDDEQIHEYTLAELAEHAGGDSAEDTPFSDLIVLAVRTEVAGE